MIDSPWIALVTVFLLIIISAFFSGAETGLTAASRARLTELARQGSARAATVLKLTEVPERLIGALLLGREWPAWGQTTPSMPTMPAFPRSTRIGSKAT